METGSHRHVFMVSFPGQGHVNPLLRLAKKLANHGLFVTLSAPQIMAQSIRKSNSNIREGEPTPYGNGGTISFELFDDGWDTKNPDRGNLDAYMAQLERAGREKLPAMIRQQEEKGRPVCCLVGNPFIPWASDVAEELGLPCAVLWVQSCACFSAYYHYYNELAPFPGEEAPEIDVQLPEMPLLRYDEVPSFLHPTTPYPFLARAILGQFKNLGNVFCVLMDTFEELERGVVAHVSELIGRPVRTIGPLFKEFASGDEDDSKRRRFGGAERNMRVDLFEADGDIVEWLYAKPSRSVVYVSFGSVVHLKQEQVDELAYGLLSSGVSFIWVLRPPLPETNLEAHVLPAGFLEGVGDRGRVVRWSPQEEVLSHPSTACFLTHCGWNSSVEALASGVPVVAFPQWGDQVTNAKFLVDVFGVGTRMCRGEAEGRVVGREEVERCLREATSGEKAEEIWKNAERWRRSAEEALTEGKGSSWRNMKEFVDEIVGLSSSSGIQKIIN